jgi:isopentenyl diphosphate isomerase/L-lactate dehydrogenase-like FMN-dependent dehydrogenase
MEAFPKISAEELKRFLHSKVDDVAEKIIDSMNAAGVGELIANTEEPVRKTLHDFGRAAFEAAVQQKLNAAEAAFPPSGGRDDRKEDGQ